MAERMTAGEAREKIDAAWRDWLDALNSVPEARWTEPGVSGEWSIKDILGHIAVWDNIAVQKLGRQAKNAGEATPAPEKSADEINAETSAARKDRTVEQQRDEMQQSHANLLHVLAGTEHVDGDQLAEDTWDHYSEHTAHVRAWT
jgi:uncharacterized damage-inducible protein DinB